MGQSQRPATSFPVLARHCRRGCKELGVDGIWRGENSFLGRAKTPHILSRRLSRDNKPVAAAHKFVFQEFYQAMTLTPICRSTFHPYQERHAFPASPRQSLPRGQIIVAAADDHLWIGASQGAPHARVQEQVISPKAPPPAGQDLVGKADFVLVNPPLTLRWIRFRQKDHMQSDRIHPRQCVENRDPIRSDDFGQQNQLAGRL